MTHASIQQLMLTIYASGIPGICVCYLTQLSALSARKLVFTLLCAADKDKSKEDRQKEEELLQQIHKLVETRDFLVDDVEFERLR